MIKRAVFRVDASLNMGSGHVMRCLTLADALRAQGGECHFICREHQGNMLEFIRQRGYSVIALPAGPEHFQPAADSAPPVLAHAAWLGCDWLLDAEQSRPVLEWIQPDWLVVDHYALDARWETALRPYYRKLMVIDDLADRHHDCDVLLDQTFGRNPADYGPWAPSACTLLCGSQYALLRPEFAALRNYSLQRRESPQLEHLLVSMGGVDKDNTTCRVLEALKTSELPANCRITVVMGITSALLADVHQQAEQMPWATTVRVGVSDMAQLMADSDLAVGAAGASSWERCCLGLPAVMVVLAENQRQVAQGLGQVGAVHVIQSPQLIPEYLPVLLAPLISSPSQRAIMSLVATRIADGSGVATVIRYLEF